MSQTDPEPLKAPLVWLLATLIAAPLCARFPLLRVRGFNPDEFEHLHASWLVAAGQLPYRDFFEHHTPALYYLLQPLFHVLDVDDSVADAWSAIFWARTAMVFFSAAALGLTWWFGRRWRGSATAWASAFLLGNTAIFLSKTLEIRPDVPALAFLLAALLCGGRGLTAAGAGPASRWLGLAGALLAVALLFTQKILFVLPGFALALLWRILQKKLPPVRPRTLAVAAAGFALPLTVTAAFFWNQGALGRFVELNFLLNARWKYRLGPGPLFLELLRQEWLLFLLAAVGAVAAGRRWRSEGRPETRAGDVLLGSCLASLAVGAFVIPVAQRQYALMALPPLALLAGAGLAELARPGRGIRSWLAVAVVVPLSAGLSAQRLHASFGRTNTGTLENIRYVLRNVSAGETVLDGFSGEGVFRRNAYYYFFLHDEIRLLVGADDLLGRLRRGEAVPKLVLFDRHLQEWSPELADFLRTHYADIGQPPIRVRLFDNGLGLWNEEGWRPLAGTGGAGLAEPHLFVGNGWRRVEVEGAAAFRATRGPRASLTLPVRDVADFTLVLRARPDPAEPASALDLIANGASLGTVPITAGWHDTEWPLPAPMLRRGLNDLVLAPRPPSASVHVQSLQLRHRP